MRDVRDRIYDSLNINKSWKPYAHRITVLLKRRGISGPPRWPELCSDVINIATLLKDEFVFNNEFIVTCIDPVTLTLEEEIRAIHKSTIIISEHGTLSLAVLYAVDGTVLITIGHNALLKEPQMLLFATHFQTFYMSADDKSDLYGTIKHALQITTKCFELL